MNITRNEMIVYIVIAIIIAGAAAYYASTLLGQTVSVSVKVASLSGNQGTLYPYDSTNLRVYVNNTGNAQINSMLLGTYVNDQELQTYKLTLPPGTGATINFTYIYPANGTYELEAVADPGHLLNLQNRAVATSSFSASVATPQVPDVYTSVPDNSITYSQHFILLPKGLLSALYLSENFQNQSMFAQVANNNNPLLLAIYRDLLASGYIDNIAGAYTTYANSSTSYVAWMQGLTNLSDIGYIVHTFGLVPGITTQNGTNVLYAKLNPTTSFCALYYRGWTKMFEYTNSSNSVQTCTSITATSYTSTESAKVANQIASTSNFTRLEGSFVYLNTTPIGRSLFDYSNTLAFMNMFQSTNASFAAYAVRNPVPLSFNTMNLTCFGFILNYNNSSVCSKAAYPINKSLSGIVLVNTTEFNRNYTFRVLSLINATLATTSTSVAHASAFSLINSLDVPGPNGQWKPQSLGACSFNNASILVGCAVMNYNFQNANITMQLTNKFSNAIKINSISCFAPAFRSNQSVGVAIPSGKSINVTTGCVGSTPGAVFIPVLVYSMSLNYTNNNVVKSVNGTVLINQ